MLPSALDRVSRGLLIRAQTAISSALDSVTDDAVEAQAVRESLRQVSLAAAALALPAPAAAPRR